LGDSFDQCLRHMDLVKLGFRSVHDNGGKGSSVKKREISPSALIVILSEGVDGVSNDLRFRTAMRVEITL
jgi:hypothetical protein